MENNSNSKENFFEKFGLEVTNQDVAVGSTYPIYGMITKILNDTPGEVKVELNFSIDALMTIDDAEKVELLKSRAFEPGIFVAKVVEKGSRMTVDCTTVVFGKRAEYSA